MTIKKEWVEQIVLDTVSELTEQFGINFETNKGIDSPLFGKGSDINSIVLVNIIVLLEDRIFEETDKQIVIANDRAFSQTTSPFKKISNLIDYILQLMNEE